jgi:hypothetical protein
MLRFLAAVGRFLVAIFALIIIVLAAGAGWVLAIIWYPDIDLPRTETAREIASVVGAVCGVILAGSIFGLAAAIYDMHRLLRRLVVAAERVSVYRSSRGDI